MLLTAVASALSLLLASAPEAPVLIAAGDVASCDSSADEATAALLARMPGTIAMLGDAVYDRSTAKELRDCYSWARFRRRTRAALGNHDYGSGDADDAIAYFGLPRRGYYSYELGAWHVVVLNTECEPAGGCGRGSPQLRWLEADLRRHPTRCAVAYTHRPRFSSGRQGSEGGFDHLWATLARGGVDVVLAAHDHHYERLDLHLGIRSFVVGTGGGALGALREPLERPRTIRRSNRTHGVLRLRLRPAAYDWTFVPVAGSSFRDAGSASCGR